MINVGVTGKPGSGKSLVCKMLGEYSDIFTINCDMINKDVIIDNSKEVFKLLNMEGYFSFSRIRDIVFTDHEKLTILENFVKPKILKTLNEIWNGFRSDKDLICFTEVPLLYESRWEKLFDSILLVRCDDEERNLRLYYRGWTEKMIEVVNSRFVRIDKASPQFMINTTCTLVDLTEKVKDFYYSMKEVKLENECDNSWDF